MPEQSADTLHTGSAKTCTQTAEEHERAGDELPVSARAMQQNPKPQRGLWNGFRLIIHLNLNNIRKYPAVRRVQQTTPLDVHRRKTETVIIVSIRQRRAYTDACSGGCDVKETRLLRFLRK